MAAKASEGHPRPGTGDTLIVIHDFHARSSDELSLSKGDRVELIERDDEFGDGWFLGRHLINGNTGLFPEVYTRPAPKNVPGPEPPLTNQAPTHSVMAAAQTVAAVSPLTSNTNGVPKSFKSPKDGDDACVSPSIFTVSEVSARQSNSSLRADISPTVSPLISQQAPGQDSRVLSETLHVIDEHITRLRSPQSTGSNLRSFGNDSESEYSVPLDHRMSYIRGAETDEEEDPLHSREEVEAWSADQVAQYLSANGVEKQHCDVFRDQEISGEVILGMDQSSLFIKAFDLGSVGRRLKTWHKIKALQDEIANNNNSLATKRHRLQSYRIEEDARGSHNRTNTLVTSSSNRPSSTSTKHTSSQASKASSTTQVTPVSPLTQSTGQMQPGHAKRPSAASIREMYHSRRHSSTELQPGSPPPSLEPSVPSVPGVHKKQPSFDRNWTLGNALGKPEVRSLSSAGLADDGSAAKELPDSAVDLDRGYFSGTEAEGRRRKVLRKRDSVGGTHSRQSSYAEEQRVRVATTLSRHSRFGSVDSYRDGLPTAAQKYYGIPALNHGRSASITTTESQRGPASLQDKSPPTVTKLEEESSRLQPLQKHQGFNSDWLSSMVSRPGQKHAREGLRVTSEKVTSDRLRGSIVDQWSIKDSVSLSPATGESTPSMAQSVELEGADNASSTTGGEMATRKGSKKKGKKGTSAYTRGLLKIGPAEAKEGADYCGWMKKKSSHLMTTWKPRFFVLKGRRLSYYYSEQDSEEKGLIDISFHRVLPADNDRLTGLHATISNAVGGPSLPNSSLLAEKGSSEEGEKSSSNEADFIFKLVPPRAGLSRAVTFTKPMVHYFAVPNVKQGRLWMAALMKATIDRDDSQAVTSTYQQKTISLGRAKQMRHRPPALMNLDERADEEESMEEEKRASKEGNAANGLGIFGEADSGVSGLEKLGKSSTGMSEVGSSEGVVPQSA